VCSVTRVCALPAGGSSLYWSSSFGGQDSRLSISSFSSNVFACLSSLSVKASTVVPAQGFAYRAAHLTSAPLRLYKYSLGTSLLDCHFDFCSSAFALAASSEFRLLLFSLLNAFHHFLMSAFHHLFDLAQILIFFAVASRTLPIAS